MTTASAVLLSAVLIALASGGATWWAVARLAEANRYQMVNLGGGVTVRLNRQTGDLVGCEGLECREMTKGEKIIAAQKHESRETEVPPPPAGATLDP